MNYKLLYEKQKELIGLYQNKPSRIKRPNAWDTWEDRIKQFESEITALEAEEGEEKYDSLTCDICGMHPATIIINGFGTFCQEHTKYI
jgi:hypothetical protein